MVHVTCDLCGKDLRTGEDQHFVIKIEAYPVHDPAELTEADLDQDHMESISQLLRECDENDASAKLVDPYKHFRYDLCQDCHQKFVRDPMARDKEQKFDFSKN